MLQPTRDQIHYEVAEASYKRNKIQCFISANRNILYVFKILHSNAINKRPGGTDEHLPLEHEFSFQTVAWPSDTGTGSGFPTLLYKYRSLGSHFCLY